MMVYLPVKYEIIKSDQQALCVLTAWAIFLDTVWWAEEGTERHV